MDRVKLKVKIPAHINTVSEINKIKLKGFGPTLFPSSFSSHSQMSRNPLNIKYSLRGKQTSKL